MVGHDLSCPECGARMELAPSKFGGEGSMYYRCANYPNCRGAHGAHRDGTPLGIPADGRTKYARMQAHAAFDKLWKGPGDKISRHAAYRVLQDLMGMAEREAHIGRFTYDECQRLIRLLAEKFNLHPFDLAAPDPAIDDLFE